MAIYRDKAIPRINALTTKAVNEKWQEADTRKIVQRVLTDMLGWDEFENLTAEYQIRGQYADIVIQANGSFYAVVEIKQIGAKLNERHILQASNYAINEGVEWIFLTNGNVWQAYRIVFDDKTPSTQHVFSVQINDPDLKPAPKSELLYLLSAEARRKDELADYYDRRVALSGQNLACKILSDSMLDKIRFAIKADTGYKVTNAELAGALLERLFRPEAAPDRCDAIIKKIGTKKTGRIRTKAPAVNTGATESQMTAKPDKESNKETDAGKEPYGYL
ncbi:MAG: type I restriction enzyme HsdR N-terminal domain-containing protein [Coriobacteriales bacterium]|jgi:predicted type IV restriction endonuclease|nr:type I restriction enzyme HsdR N-terminal domain-containing protein [Coriobacteriales bacterium]